MRATALIERFASLGDGRNGAMRLPITVVRDVEGSRDHYRLVLCLVDGETTPRHIAACRIEEARPDDRCPSADVFRAGHEVTVHRGDAGEELR